MPSAGAPQMPQQEANPTPPTSSPEPVISPTPKKGGGLIKILVGVFAVAILGFGGWYAYDSGLFGGGDDNPPALSIAGAGFQGKSVETTFGFLQYDSGDSFSDSGKNMKAVSKGVNYFAPLRNTNFDEIESSIRPDDDLKILIAFYDKEEPWAGDNSKDGCFKVYPVGPYENTCEITESNLGSTIVPKNTSIAIIASADYEIDSGLLADAKTLSDTLSLSNANGWSMHPLATNMDLTDSRIKSLWIQKSANDFEKVTDVASLDTSREFKMAWFKLGAASTAGDTTGGGDAVAAVCGDGNVDSGEACDDGANNSDTVANACRTSCVVADCGDSVVDAGEECDGTADCESDCTLTPIVVEECGDNTINGTDVCDGTDLGGKDCTNYESGSIYSEGTLGCATDCTAYDTTLCAEGAATGAGVPVDPGPTTDPAATVEEAAPNAGVITTTTVPAATTNVTSNLSIIDRSTINTITSQPAVSGGSTETATATGNAYVESIQYIDNIENEFPGRNLTSQIQGQLYAPKSFDGTNQAGDYDCSEFCKNDSSSTYIPVTAIKVVAGGTTGNIKLKQANFFSSGYHPDYSTNYCDGAGDWELYRIKANASGGVIQEIVSKLNTTMVSERESHIFKDESAFEYNSIAATVNAGETAIFFILMEDMTACHDEEQEAGTSWSETNVTRLEFIEGDSDERVFLKSDIDYNDLNRKIFWM